MYSCGKSVKNASTGFWSTRLFTTVIMQNTICTQAEKKVYRNRLGLPVLVAPELILQVPLVTLAITERSLALDPVNDVTIHCHWYLQLQIGSLVIAPSFQAVLICQGREAQKECEVVSNAACGHIPVPRNGIFSSSTLSLSKYSYSHPTELQKQELAQDWCSCDRLCQTYMYATIFATDLSLTGCMAHCLMLSPRGP